MGGQIADLDDWVSAAPPLDGASRLRPQRGRGRQGTNGEESDGGAAGVAGGGTVHDGPGPAPFRFIFMGGMRPSLRRLGVLAKRRHAGHLSWGTSRRRDPSWDRAQTEIVEAGLSVSITS